jgi:NADH-quinone oxidoreductase subunit N
MIFGSVSGALLLYGLAILFSSTHAINMYDMHRALIAAPFSQQIGLVTFMLIFLGLCFQVAAFPMYLWAPDVLEGSPTAVSAFLSLGPRAAGFAVAIRFLLVVFAQPTLTPGQWQVLNGLDWTRIVGLISGMTMLMGSLLALRQEGAKRMVAYIVMAETGFLLLGVLVLDEVGLAALLYNFIVELFALMGAFCVLSFLFDEIQSDRLSDLRGMLGKAVPESVFLIVFLACLVGMPPLPGFIGKFTLIGAAIRHQWNVLAVVAIASIALCSISVARLAYSLLGDFRKPADSSVDPDLARRAILVAILIPMVLVGVFADSVLGWAGQSLRFILW